MRAQKALADTITKAVIVHTIGEIKRKRACYLPVVALNDLDGVESVDLLHMRHGVEFLYSILCQEEDRTRDWVSTAGLFARKGSS